MHRFLIGLAATALLAGCASYGDNGHMSAGWGRYDYNHPDPNYGGYEADRYYRADGNRYPERQLSNDDRVYRGHDGRYYCRRSDGTTGLIVGAIAGGTLGGMIAPGRSEALGVVLGAVAGGAAGQAIGQENGVRCR